MDKKLAKHLQKEFTTDGYNITVKEDFKFKFNGKEVIVPKSSIFVAGYKGKDPDTIVRIAKKISHAHILQMMDDYELEVEDYTIVHDPGNDNDKWGYATCKIKGTSNKTPVKTVIGDGEVAKANLMGSMQFYAYTMLRKRCIDRGVLRFFGLYQKGFYSESENVEEDYSPNTDNEYDNVPIRQVNENLLSEIMNLAKTKGLSKQETDDLAIQVLGLDMGSTVQWKQLIKSQQESILDALKNGVSEDSKEDNTDYLQLIKDHKVKQGWNQPTFKTEVLKTLEITEEINFTDISIESWKHVATKWGLV